MTSGFREQKTLPPETLSCLGNNDSNTDASNFECNICFDLAQDPIVTPCGHLFCWPCLYKWLHIHSHSQECPVCKALVEEQKLVPLYGRGKNSTDLRSKLIPGIEIPHCPAGQRPETAPPPDPNYSPQQGNGFMGRLGGFAPAPTARFGNFYVGFGGLIPSLFNIHVHGFRGGTMYGGVSGVPNGYFSPFHGGHTHGIPPRPPSQEELADFSLKLLCLVVLFRVFISIIWS